MDEGGETAKGKKVGWTRTSTLAKFRLKDTANEIWDWIRYMLWETVLLTDFGPGSRC